MLVSLRSNLIAGTAAIVGAGAVAATPLQITVPAASDAVAGVALAAFVNPFAELFASAEQFQNYVLQGSYNGADGPTPGAGEANWPSAGFDQTGGDVLNYLLTQEVDLGLYSSVGLGPQLVTNAGPIFQQLQVNWLDYLNVGLSGAIEALTALGNGIWDYPAALVDAFELAVGGDIGAAFTVLVDAVVAPVTAATQAVFNAGGYILGGVVARLAAVIETIPRNIASFVAATAGAAVLTAERSAALATQWFADIAALDFEAAWNTAWSGLLGPSGLPGLAWNMSIGPGVQTGPITDPADIADNFVPSFRTATQSTIWAVTEALATSPVTVDAAALPAEAAQPAQSAKATGVGAAPAEETTAAADPVAAEASPVAASSARAETTETTGPSATAEPSEPSANSATSATPADSETSRLPANADRGEAPAAVSDGPRTRRGERAARAGR